MAESNGQRSPYMNLIIGAALSLTIGTLVASLTWWKDFALRAQRQDTLIVELHEVNARLSRTVDTINAMQAIDQTHVHDIKDLQHQASEAKRYLEQILARLRALEVQRFRVGEPEP